MKHQQRGLLSHQSIKSEQNSQTEMPLIYPATPQKAKTNRAKSNRLPSHFIDAFKIKGAKSPQEIQEILKSSIKNAGTEVRMKFRIPTSMNFKLSRDISHLDTPLSLHTERNWMVNYEEYIHY